MSLFVFFFFKQKTAYEMVSDWSSDVCSSDLVQAYTALLGKFEGVGEQILEHLLHPLRVADEATGEVWIHVHIKTEPPILRSEERRVGKECRSRGVRYD